MGVPAIRCTRAHHTVSNAWSGGIVAVRRGGELLKQTSDVVYCLRFHESNITIVSLSDQREIAMSDASDVGPVKTAPKPFWNTRNIVGLVVLAGVTVVGVIEYSAYFGHKWAVSALNTRTADEDKELMSISEAEKLLGKASDGPATSSRKVPWNFNQKTYTWNGLLKKHTVTAYYTKGQDARLHHFESDGAKFEPPPVKTVEMPTEKQTQRQRTGGGMGGMGGGIGKAKSKGSSAVKDKAADGKDKAAEGKRQS